MGTSESKPQIIYSKQVAPAQSVIGETPIRRHPNYIDGVLVRTDNTIINMRDAYDKAFSSFPENKCLGSIVTEGENRKVSYKNYRQVKQIAVNFAKGIIASELVKEVEEVPGLPMRLLGIFSENRIEWNITDIGCAYYKLTTVPLYNTLGKQNLMHVLEETNIETCICSRKCLEILLKLQNLANLKNIICFDCDLSPEIIKIASSKKLNIFYYNLIIEKGSKCSINLPDISQDDIVTFCYTSGTTGPPKGALLSHLNFVSVLYSVQATESIKLLPTDVYLSYLPLPHVMERGMCFNLLTSGAFIVVYGGDIQKLKDDLIIVKPTFFAGVPRIYNRFYQGITKVFQESQGFKKFIVDRAVQTKIENVKQGNLTHSIYDSLVFDKVKQALGGNIRMMLTGSAPIMPEVHNFLKIITSAPLLEAYGQTESTSAAFHTDFYDSQTGHVGGPWPGLEFKLQDIPDMNYTSTHKNQKGQLRPRGEICFRGPFVFKGYYKNIEKTNEAIDKDGWLHTGDVAQLLPRGEIKIIDRKKNIFKLQQGQYVAPEKVENLCIKSKLVTEMYLYGTPFESYAVAIIVPVKQQVQKIALNLKIEGKLEQLCANLKITKQFLKLLNEFTKKQGLNSFEQPKNIRLVTQPFLTKGVYNNTMKFQRFVAKQVFKTEIDAMYKEGMI